MSTRGTIFLTSKGDHWYEDSSTLSMNSTPGNRMSNVHISVGREDIVSMEYCKYEKTWFFEIDGGSELANNIRNARKWYRQH